MRVGGGCARNDCICAHAGETLSANRLNGCFQSRLRSLYNLWLCGECLPACEEILANGFPLSPQDLEHALEGFHEYLLYPRPLADQAIGKVLGDWLGIKLPVRPAGHSVRVEREPLLTSDCVHAGMDGVTQRGLGGLDEFALPFG